MKKNLLLTILLTGCLALSACGTDSTAPVADEPVDEVPQAPNGNGDSDIDLSDLEIDPDSIPEEVTDIVGDILEEVAGDNSDIIPPDENLEAAFTSFITWAGLQEFYHRYEFSSFDEEAAVCMAIFTAQTNATDVVYSEDGASQLVTEDDINQAMFDLFGEAYDISAVSEEMQSKSMVQITENNSAYITLGDWGLVYPVLEILTVDAIDDSESNEFVVHTRYYAKDAEEDFEPSNLDIPSYCCTFLCVPDEISRYGFIIKDMSATIVEE